MSLLCFQILLLAYSDRYRKGCCSGKDKLSRLGLLKHVDFLKKGLFFRTGHWSAPEKKAPWIFPLERVSCLKPGLTMCQFVQMVYTNNVIYREHLLSLQGTGARITDVSHSGPVFLNDWPQKNWPTKLKSASLVGNTLHMLSHITAGELSRYYVTSLGGMPRSFCLSSFEFCSRHLFSDFVCIF